MEETKKEATVLNNEEKQVKKEDEMKMEDLLGPEVQLRAGQEMKVRVVGESPDGVLVDLGMKSEGLILKEEFSTKEDMKQLKENSEIIVLVKRMHSDKGHPIVSYREVKEKEAWKNIDKSFKEKAPIEGLVKRKVKGGFIVDIGVDAFLPASQLEIGRIKDMTKYIGESYSFAITEVNRQKKNIVLSRKKLLEEEHRKKRQEVLKTLNEDQIVDGIVSTIAGFGAFVDIGGVEGLLHIGDLEWYHVKKVSDVLKSGQKVRVKILQIDKEKEKISLGMKQLKTKPWDNADTKYKPGTTIAGKITSIADFGIFVALEPGIEGLVHVSEVSWTDHDPKVKGKYKVGQEIEAKVVSVDIAKEKMSLSLKRLKSNPWEEAKKHYPEGSKAKGIVTKFLPFGTLVKLPEGIEGLINIADMSWMRKVKHPQDMLKMGQQTDVVVLKVNEKDEKIALSIKHLGEDPFKKYRSGKIVKGKVKKLAEFGAFVELEHGIDALIRNSEIAQKKIAKPSEVLKVGQEIEAKVIKSDPSEKKIDVSIKRLESDREKELINKYVNKETKHTLGDLLEEE